MKWLKLGAKQHKEDLPKSGKVIRGIALCLEAEYHGQNWNQFNTDCKGRSMLGKMDLDS